MKRKLLLYFSVILSFIFLSALANIETVIADHNTATRATQSNEDSINTSGSEKDTELQQPKKSIFTKIKSIFNPSLSKINNEGGVRVRVTLMHPGVQQFKITMNSKDIDLSDVEITKAVILRADDKEYQPEILTSLGSEHHRYAVIKFYADTTSKGDVIIKSVGGVSERVFTFSLNP